MDAAAVREHRLAGHGLVGPGRAGGSVVDVVHRIVAIHAQLPTAAALTIRVRTTGLKRGNVDAAIADQSVLKLWGPRGTLHLVTASDAGWLVALLGPRMVRAGKRRLAQMGVDDDTAAGAVRALRAAVRRGPATRSQLTDTLRRAGLPVDRERQLTYHLLHRAGAQGVLCFASPTDGEETFCALGDVASPDDGPRGEDAIRLLINRYQRTYSPATLADFVSWSGLPLADVRPLWRDVPPPATAVFDGPVVRLLPHFDNYLLGYRDRSAVLAPRLASQVQTGGGYIHPTVTVDGVVVGLWKVDAGRVTVTANLGSDKADADLQEEVADVQRFIRGDLRVSPVPSVDDEGR